MGEEKWIKYTPHEIQKIFWVAFTKKLEILKSAGSRAELHDYNVLIIENRQ